MKKKNFQFLSLFILHSSPPSSFPPLSLFLPCSVSWKLNLLEPESKHSTRTFSFIAKSFTSSPPEQNVSSILLRSFSEATIFYKIRNEILKSQEDLQCILEKRRKLEDVRQITIKLPECPATFFRYILELFLEKISKCICSEDSIWLPVQRH